MRFDCLAGFARSERGAVNILMIFFVLCLLVVGGIVLDLSNRHRVLAMLQATADVSATSGAVRLAQPKPGSTPRTAAQATALASLDVTHLRGAWTHSGFELGTMAEEGSVAFSPGGAEPNAVRVTLKRTTDNGNPEPTMLLHLIGINKFDLQAQSIARIKRQKLLPCVDPLLSLKSRVDVGETDLYAGICLKVAASAEYGIGQTWLTLQAAEFVDGLLARIAGLDQRSLSIGGGLSLVGLGDDALSEARWLSRDLSRDAARLAAAAPHVLEAALFSSYELRAGESYHIACDPDEVLRIKGPRVLRNVALYSDCPIEFDADVEVEMSLILSNLSALLGNPGPLSLDGTISLQSGANCHPGDGARIFLFLDANVAAGIPALVDPASPFGGYLQTVWDETGSFLAQTQAQLSPVLSDLASALTLTADALGLAKVCLGPEIMLRSDSVKLH